MFQNIDVVISPLETHLGTTEQACLIGGGGVTILFSDCLNMGLGSQCTLKKPPAGPTMNFLIGRRLSLVCKKGDVHSVRLFWELRILSSLGSTMV